MKLLIHYKKKRIHKIIKNIDKKDNINIYDSCMGTAGWLVYANNILKEEYKDRLQLSGGEVKSTTFQYGLMNLILTLHKFPFEMDCNSSLTCVNNTKHHICLTNPPFKTSKKFEDVIINFKEDKITTKNKIKLDDVYKLNSNNPPTNF